MQHPRRRLLHRGHDLLDQLFRLVVGLGEHVRPQPRRVDRPPGRRVHRERLRLRVLPRRDHAHAPLPHRQLSPLPMQRSHRQPAFLLRPHAQVRPTSHLPDLLRRERRQLIGQHQGHQTIRTFCSSPSGLRNIRVLPALISASTNAYTCSARFTTSAFFRPVSAISCSSAVAASRTRPQLTRSTTDGLSTSLTVFSSVIGTPPPDSPRRRPPDPSARSPRRRSRGHRSRARTSSTTRGTPTPDRPTPAPDAAPGPAPFPPSTAGRPTAGTPPPSERPTGTRPGGSTPAGHEQPVRPPHGAAPRRAVRAACPAPGQCTAGRDRRTRSCTA